MFGIVTVFQLLELANPSQPLLRRLLVETPGTYHHSLMVGNLAERAAESIGGDPLLARVAAYYHDVGKLSNPAAFIENQAGGDNIHDELDPETSAQLLKSHVSAGIDIAYKSGLPKALIAFIPQHHGTAVMSYFYARAKEQAAAPFGGLETAEGRKAADAVDVRKFRHGGPKPQSREAAIIMLADSVEASVRSLSSRDEAAIRAMVARIFEERIATTSSTSATSRCATSSMIREAFVEQLLGMYHQRVAYPQNKVVELESRRAAGGDGVGGAGAKPLPRPVADRRRVARRRPAPAPRDGPRARGRGGPRRRRRAPARLARPDPLGRRGAGGAQRGPHGQGRPDGRPLVPAAAARTPTRRTRARPRRRGGRAPARPSRCRPASAATWATSSCPWSGRSTRPRPAAAARRATSAGTPATSSACW